MERINDPLFTHRYTYVEGGNENTQETLAMHDFVVRASDDGRELGRVHFQQGAINEHGVNGICNEDLLLMVLSRLRSWQGTEFACRENACAITKLEEAVMWLRKRTQEREARGVVGTHAV